MELFYELLLTAAASLLVAFLLAKLFSTNDPRREPDRAAGPAAAIAEEEEEERIIEVDEFRVKGARADVAAEGWIEVEKAPATVVESLAEEEGVLAKVPRELFLGAMSEEREEEGEVGEKQCDLTAAAAAAATETVVEVKPHDLGAEAAPGEVHDVGLEKERVQDVGAEQHESGAEAAPCEALDSRLDKQGAQVSEATELKRQHLVAGAAPAEVLDAGLEEERGQAIEVRPCELASETVPGEVLDVVFEKQEEHVIEVKQHELAAVVAPREILDVALAEKGELKEQPVEEAVDVHEGVQSKEEAKCEAHSVDQQQELFPKELVVRKTGDLEVSQEGSSNDKVAVQLPEKDVTLLGMPEDEAGAGMEFGEWEGIERSEVEKRFGAAAAFAASGAGTAALSKLDSNVQLQLQGLLKVAIDGPCYESTQPLTLRPSSRAKWVAWQKLGNMHPEIAMEKYTNLLSDTIPGWMGDKTSDTKKHEADGDSEGPVLTMTAHSSDQHSNQG